MGPQTPPKQMAQRLARVLRPARPEYAYLTKVFQHTRALLAVKPAARGNDSRTCSPIESSSRFTKPSGRPVTRCIWS